MIVLFALFGQRAAWEDPVLSLETGRMIVHYVPGLRKTWGLVLELFMATV